MRHPEHSLPRPTFGAGYANKGSTKWRGLGSMRRRGFVACSSARVTQGEVGINGRGWLIELVAQLPHIWTRRVSGLTEVG